MLQQSQETLIYIGGPYGLGTMPTPQRAFHIHRTETEEQLSLAAGERRESIMLCTSLLVDHNEKGIQTLNAAVWNQFMAGSYPALTETQRILLLSSANTSVACQ